MTKKEEKRVREQIKEIAERIEFIAETEPAILNIIQRMIEGLSIIDNETISLTDTGVSKIATMRKIGRLKTNKCINGMHLMAKSFERIEIQESSK
ncbi:MAG: hypothetical protein RSD47_08980 [Romboutsia sp.]